MKLEPNNRLPNLHMARKLKIDLWKLKLADAVHGERGPIKHHNIRFG